MNAGCQRCECARYIPIRRGKDVSYTSTCRCLHNVAAHLSPQVINARRLAEIHGWSLMTFGPGSRQKGIIDHITKELRELKATNDPLSEWVDIIILGFDGALRSGVESQEVIDAVIQKWKVNMERMWPDWRQFNDDQAIEHIRSTETTCQCPSYDDKHHTTATCSCGHGVARHMGENRSCVATINSSWTDCECQQFQLWYETDSEDWCDCAHERKEHNPVCEGKVIILS